MNDILFLVFFIVSIFCKKYFISELNYAYNYVTNIFQDPWYYLNHLAIDIEPGLSPELDNETICKIFET